MRLTQHLKIDNSLDSANKDGNSRRTTADFYKKIMKKVEWKELLKETYLVAQVDNIQNDEKGITPFTECNFLYPHHEIYNDKLILSILKLKKAFVDAVKHRNYSGEVKQHLERHMKDLEGVIDFNAVFTFNFGAMYEILEDRIRELCDSASEAFVLKTTQFMYEELKHEQARQDAKYWLENGTYRESPENSIEKIYLIAEDLIFRQIAFNPWKYLEEAKLTKETALKICAVLNKHDYDAAAYRFMECWKECEAKNNKSGVE